MDPNFTGPSPLTHLSTWFGHNQWAFIAVLAILVVIIAMTSLARRNVSPEWQSVARQDDIESELKELIEEEREQRRPDRDKQ